MLTKQQWLVLVSAIQIDWTVIDYVASEYGVGEFKDYNELYGFTTGAYTGRFLGRISFNLGKANPEDSLLTRQEVLAYREARKTSAWAQDQKEFMHLGGQTAGILHEAQLARYMSHIEEESREAMEAYSQDDPVALVDGLVDTIVGAIGALHSLGVDPDRAWSIVHAANMRKFPGGKPYYLADGQIGKPTGWVGPEPALALMLDELGLADKSLLEPIS